MEQKNKKLCLIIPCILDEESVNENVRTIRQNLLNANPDFTFDLVIHIDNNLRPTSTGTLDSVEALYRSLENAPNCNLKVLKASPKKGLLEVDGILLEEFLKTDSQVSLRIDDDSAVNHPVYLNEFFDLIDDTKIIRLSFGWDPGYSCESPFITNSVFMESKTIKIYENDKWFCSENGSFWTRKMAEELLKVYDRKNPPKGATDVLEKQAGKCAWLRSLPIYTLAWATEGCKVSTPETRWKLPIENHFLLDQIRKNRQMEHSRQNACEEIRYYH